MTNIVSSNDDDETGVTMTTDRTFRFSNQRALLTYKTHIDKESLTKILKSGRFSAKEVYIAHEMGHNETPYEHTHVLIEFGEIFRSSSCNIFDIKVDRQNIHPNIRKITSKTHLMNAYAYMCKEDHTNDFLLEKTTNAFSRSIWSCKSITEALGTCKKPSDVQGTITMYKNKPKELDTIEITPRPWQQEVLDIIESAPNSRAIHWFYDEQGNTGKSYICKYLLRAGKAKVFTNFDGSRNAAQLIRSILEAGWDGKCLVVDLARNTQSHQIYGPLEEIKNGMMTSTKYDGACLDWDAGHVIVFANFEPNRAAMSQDRWHIHKIHYEN